MATILFTAIGTAVGGPLGGTIGALIGNQVDQQIFKPGGRDGPRLKEVQVTTSTYGTPIARHFGKVRAAGSLVWSTDLKESTEESGGGKGQPSTSTYSYSISFAVALASRPIRDVGRIWADGNLLRGAAGDLKTGGELRIYRGFGDQLPDPLIEADRGGDCSAFRGTAYCVFENLQLADFGNRIPSLTFEIIADDGEVDLGQMLAPIAPMANISRDLPALRGFTQEGGPAANSLYSIGQLYPLAFDTGGEVIAIRSAEAVPAAPPVLPEAASDASGESFGSAAGEARTRQPDQREIPEGVRYYDTSRDFQPGLQRADGRARPGRTRIIEFPGALAAVDARNLANQAAERAFWACETLSWRTAELDPGLSPGKVVTVPGKAGHWRIGTWEWSASGIELELERLPFGPARSTLADPGAVASPPDRVGAPTLLESFELPWDGHGSPDQRHVHAAASSISDGWTGAALYGVQGSSLVLLGPSARRRSILGHSVIALSPATAQRLDRESVLEVALCAEDLELVDATPADLSAGANRAILGDELIQFARAERIAGSTWRLRHLLRGRGGTEVHAQTLHPVGTTFVLLNDAPVAIDPVRLGSAQAIAAIGLRDTEPVRAPIISAGRSLKPLVPVHPRLRLSVDGALLVSWTRRARGAWDWPDHVDAPLNEQSEKYLAGLGDINAPVLFWEVNSPTLELSAQTVADLAASHAGKPLWVRQIGARSSSDPLLLLEL